MSVQGLIDYCMRADLVDTNYVLKEVTKLRRDYHEMEIVAGKAVDIIAKTKEALAQIAMMAGESGDDAIRSIALGALNEKAN